MLKDYETEKREKEIKWQKRWVIKKKGGGVVW